MPWGAVEDLIALFGKARAATPTTRGGYSAQNVERLGKLGVRNIGLAPRGRAPWEVQGKVRDRLIRSERWSQGFHRTIKCNKIRIATGPAARQPR